jgi:hypothetical protein
MVECFLDFTVDREEDAAAALIVFPLFVGAFYLALRFYRNRIAQRQQWRDNREMQWWLTRDLPELEITDWDAYEHGIEYRVGGGWRTTADTLSMVDAAVYVTSYRNPCNGRWN